MSRPLKILSKVYAFNSASDQALDPPRTKRAISRITRAHHTRIGIST